MAPDLILVVAGLSAAWAVLSIVGSERQRVMQIAESARRADQSAQKPQKDKSPAPLPTKSSSAATKSK